MNIVLSQEEWNVVDGLWHMMNERRKSDGKRPLKPIFPPLRLRKEGFFGFYKGPIRYRVDMREVAECLTPKDWDEVGR